MTPTVQNLNAKLSPRPRRKPSRPGRGDQPASGALRILSAAPQRPAAAAPAIAAAVT